MTDSKAPGRAVEVWGKVKGVNGNTSFVVSDGYNTTGITVMTNGVSLPVGFETTKTAVVTGILKADKSIQAQAISVAP